MDKGAHVIVSGGGRVRVGCRTLCNYKDVLLNYLVKCCNPAFFKFFWTNNPPAFLPTFNDSNLLIEENSPCILPKDIQTIYSGQETFFTRQAYFFKRFILHYFLSLKPLFKAIVLLKKSASLLFWFFQFLCPSLTWCFPTKVSLK